MLKVPAARANVHASQKKWLLQRKCYYGDDLEAILSAIKDNLLDENEEFTSELNGDVEEFWSSPTIYQFFS